MPKISIDAEKFRLIETNPEVSTSELLNVAEQVIILEGRPHLESTSPDSSFDLVRESNRIPTPNIATVRVEANEHINSEERFTGSICYVDEYTHDESPKLNYPAQIEINIGCSSSTLDKLRERMFCESVKISFCGYFHTKYGFDESWDVTDDASLIERSKNSRHLTNIVIETYRETIDNDYTDFFLRQKNKYRDLEEESLKTYKKSIQASSYEAIGGGFLALVVYATLMLLGASQSTAFTTTIIALISYFFRYIFILLHTLDMSIDLTRKNINSNHASFFDDKK